MSKNIVSWKNLTPTHLNRDEFLNSVDSIFDSFWNQSFPEFGKTFGINQFEKHSFPKIDAISYSDRVEIEAAVPGLTKDDVNIEYSDGVLTISGEKKTSVSDGEQGDYIFRELKRSSFKRSLNLDSNLLNTDNISASFKDGILKLNIPKIKVVKKESKKIDIN